MGVLIVLKLLHKDRQFIRQENQKQNNKTKPKHNRIEDYLPPLSQFNMVACHYWWHSKQKSMKKINKKNGKHLDNMETRTNVHNWSLQPISQDYDLASRTTYVVCINFIHK